MTGLEIYWKEKYCKCKKRETDSEFINIDSGYFKLTACINCQGIVTVGEWVSEIEFYNDNNKLTL